MAVVMTDVAALGNLPDAVPIVAWTTVVVTVVLQLLNVISVVETVWTWGSRLGRCCAPSALPAMLSHRLTTSP